MWEDLLMNSQDACFLIQGNYSKYQTSESEEVVISLIYFLRTFSIMRDCKSIYVAGKKKSNTGIDRIKMKNATHSTNIINV